MTAIPLLSILGGALIGLSAVLLMAFHGRIAGISGILAGVLPPVSTDWGWRAAFLIGAIAAPALLLMLGGPAVGFESPVPTSWVIIGGLLVGIGTYLGSGCTSGHGVCGIARLSPRSLIATATFMASAVLTVYVIRHLVFPS